MKILKQFIDDFNNAATIDHSIRYPYHGAKTTDCYRLSLASRDDNYIYHITVHETLEDAVAELSNYSCGTFLEV